MNGLIIPLATIPAKGLSIAAELQDDAATGVSAGTIHVEGTLEAVDSEFLFRGKLTGKYKGACDRCLRESSRPYAMEVVWFFEPGEAEAELPDAGETFEISDEDEIDPPRKIAGSNLNLTEHVLEEVQLAIPSKFLCNDDCKGLCAKCGANLNDGPCACPAENSTGHPGLANLAEMFPDLKQSN